MKKLTSLLVILMAIFVITGCSSNSKNEDKTSKKADIEEKDNKKENDKKDNNKKDDDKKDNDKKDNDKKDNDKKDSDALTCSVNIEGMKTEMKYTWNNGKVNTVKVVMAMDLSSYGIDESMFDMLAEQLSSTYMDQVKQQYGLPENQEGLEINYTVNKENKTMDISIYVDAEKINPELLNDTSLFNKEELNKTYEEMKNELVAAGATCN